MDFDIMEKWNKRKPNNRFPTEADLATISETLKSIRFEACHRDRKSSFTDPEKLGKILTRLFKYPDNMANEGVWMDPAGLVPLDELVSLPKLRNQWTEQDVRQFIEDQEEETFVLLEDDLGQVYIKAVNEGDVGMGILVKAPVFDEKLSKTLCWALRHTDKIKRLRKDDYGYAPLAAILKFEQFRKWTVEDIYQLAEYYRVCRGYEPYEIKKGKNSGKILIRAYYGHSISVPKAYREIKDPSREKGAVAVRGLTVEIEKWEDVKEKGLTRDRGTKSKEKKNQEKKNIWFRNVEPTLQQAEASGKHIFVFVDVMKAMKDGYKFFRAGNNFLGTPGNGEGFLPPKYFKKVVDFKTGEELEFNRDSFAFTKQPREFDAKLNKRLSLTLRHTAKKVSLLMDEHGYVELEALLNHPKFAGKWTEQDIRQLMEISKWVPSYEIKREGASGKDFIRAYHGHSISVPKAYEELKGPSLEEALVSVAIRGLTVKRDKWKDVKEKGLSRNKGKKKKEILNIWFCTVEPTLQQVEASGKHIFVFVDVMKALKDGYKFYRAGNNFLGTPGNEGGFLPPKYFKKVVDFKTGEELEFNRD